MVNTVVEQVMATITVDGKVDFEALKDIIAALTETKKSLADVAKAEAKLKKAENKELAVAEGKNFAKENIHEGDTISWIMSDGSVKTGKVVKLNEKTIRVIRDDTEGYKPSKDGNCYANVGYDKLVRKSAEAVA